METLSNGTTLDTGSAAFPLSTDSMLLADFVRLPKNARVLDLGSGCGTLGLLLCDRNSSCSVTGIELNQDAHALAMENIRRNRLEARLFSICGDLRTVSPTDGSFHAVISNPPYFSGGPASADHPLARRQDCCEPEALFASAAKALRYGGDFFLVQRPENLAQLCACACNAHLEPKRLKLVRHRENGPVSLILLQCRKGGKPGLIWEECFLFDCDGNPSQDYCDAYSL